ncbi:hypothetical protein JW935_01210 [candidate division KSB1 bacterium]|nr:hypothetical protein [candidate division KSB1 bacterium]
MKRSHITYIFFLLLCMAGVLCGYPIDGYKTTGIRRLERLSGIIGGTLKGTMPVEGARLSLEQIKLNLIGTLEDSTFVLPPVDAEFQKRIDNLFPNRHESYSLAVLEITPGKPKRFAQRQADRQFSPGSVGKLAIAAGLFAELKKICPDSFEERCRILKSRMVTADEWILSDTHEIPVFDTASKSFAMRPARIGDVFSLYEWADHMLSASANSAASITWKEVVLMRAFGAGYPPSAEQEKEFFQKTPKSQIAEIAFAVVNEPLRAAGIEKEEFQLASLFTGTGKRKIPISAGSNASPIGLIKFLLALEQGRIVDRPSGLEIKRLMYMTAKRIRYASAPALTGAAVYFKSGSLYRCKEEPGFLCGKYMGNVENVMNSVAIVEHPDGPVYLVVLMSNVLRKNSAVEHQTIATYIDKIIKN